MSEQQERDIPAMPPLESHAYVMVRTEELAALEARLAAAESERDAALVAAAEMRAAILLERNRDYDGGPCWCWVDVSQGYRHDSACLTLRALLGGAGTEGAG